MTPDEIDEIKAAIEEEHPGAAICAITFGRSTDEGADVWYQSY